MDESVAPLVVEDMLDVEQLLAKREWQRLYEGVWISPIYGGETDGPMAAFLHYEPGALVLEHRHIGYEHIIILSGSQRDDTREYACNSLVVQSPDSTHRVVSTAGCVVLGIWEKRVQFCAPDT